MYIIEHIFRQTLKDIVLGHGGRGLNIKISLFLLSINIQTIKRLI